MKTLPINQPDVLLPHFKDPLHRLFFAVGLKTGFRVSEILSLKDSDLFLPDLTVRSQVSVERKSMKGKRVSRSVMLSEANREFIHSQYVPIKLMGLRVFPFTRVTAHRFLDRARISAGMEQRVACHSLRKTFAKRVYELSGKDLKVTQAAMGHESISSTAAYLEVGSEELSYVYQNL